MNRRAEREIMRMRGDGRNPYGSRGGYITSRDPRHRRDRGEYDEPYMDYPHERDTRHHHREYEQEPYAKMRGNFEYDRYDYGDDYDYGEDMRDYRGGRRDGRMDYGYDDMPDMRGRRRNARGQYMRDRRDYGDDMDERLTKQEMKEWEKDLINDDGSRGAHFQEEQIHQMAKQMGINPDDFQDGLLCLITNVKYSDYCAVARKYGVDRLDFYIDMAKAFLKDKDFDGDGSEKAFLYYNFIADDDK